MDVVSFLYPLRQVRSVKGIDVSDGEILEAKRRYEEMKNSGLLVGQTIY